jgi:DNA-binding transcriptional MocR family regulator
VIDLTGPPPRWSATTLAHWQESIFQASTDPLVWIQRPPRGDEGLREVLGQALGLDPAGLTITSGVRAAALSYGRVRRPIIVERPTFGGVVNALSCTGTRPELLPWTQMLSGEHPNALLWLTSPSRNPDGATLCEQDRSALARHVQQGGRAVVNDAYRWYGAEPPPVDGVELVGTLHKLIGMNTRLGWVHSVQFPVEAQPDLAAVAPPTVWQRAWAHFIATGALRALADSTNRATAEALAAYQEQIATRADTPPPETTGPHVLIPLAPDVTEAEGVTHLAARGWRVLEGRHFHVSRPALRACLRDLPPEHAAAFGRTVATDSRFHPANSDRL